MMNCFKRNKISLKEKKNTRIDMKNSVNVNLLKIIKNGLSDIDMSIYENDFHIVVKFVHSEESKTIFSKSKVIINVPHLIADIISPLIKKLHKIDPIKKQYTITIDDYLLTSIVNISQNNDQSPIMCDVIANKTNKIEHLVSMTGKLSPEDEKQLNHILNLSILFLLGNEETINDIVSLDSSFAKSITSSNVIHRIWRKLKYFKLLEKCSKRNFNINEININDFETNLSFIDKELNYLAKNMYQVDVNKLEDFSLSILTYLFSRSDLKLQNESQIYKFIRKMVSKSSDFYQLFEFVNFSFLPEEDISDFFNQFDINYLTSNIWRCLVQYFNRNHSFSYQNNLKSLCKDPIRTRYSFQVSEFKFNPHDPMNGIIRYLTNQYKGNICKLKIVDVFASGSGTNDQDISTLVDHNSDSDFWTNDVENSFFIFDFKNKRVKLTDYTIMSSRRVRCNDHPRNWVIEISNNKENWKIIDQQNNDSSLNESHVRSSFTINNGQNNEYARYVRFKQLGRNWRDKYMMQFSFIEFFGSLSMNHL
ncbi:hypothetical protein TRFO_33487 [Tritrichomonas foetus]|uniref:F5/8 type C domain-containing protein n=1 Tax=Tritrichomonas foetus TaxID=1144522 RepID=A0A1J4JMP4_9EUKA|nr:hypothetical protein TRFO_33487 [Tritrichomonas foetus]|eukprot:OHS99969.1 hypothetical protein TRFO_33487 [Tritrichomonas foetus]